MELIETISASLALLLLIYIQYWTVRFQSKKDRAKSLALLALTCIAMVPNSNLLNGDNHLTIVFSIGLILGVIMFLLCDNYLSSKAQEDLMATNNAIVAGIYLSVWVSLTPKAALASFVYLLLGYLAAYILVLSKIFLQNKIQDKLNTNQEQA